MRSEINALLSRRGTLRLGLGFALANGATAWAAGRQAMEQVVSQPTEGAVRRAIASGASRIVLPEGRIVLSQTMQVPPGTILIGAGADRTIFTVSAAVGPGQAMMEGSGDGIVLADFAMDGRARSEGGAGHGIQLSGSGHRLSGLSVRDVAQAGYRLTASDTLVEDCVAIDCGRRGHTDNHGFMLYRTSEEGLGPLHGVTFRRCSVDTAFRKGFALYSNGPEISDILYEDCAGRRCGLATESGSAFYLVPLRGVRVSRITVRDCRADQNYVNYEIGPVDGLTVIRCRSAGAQATGFLFHGARNVEIVDNTDDGSGVDAMRFDEVLGPSVGGRVANNVLMNANRSTAGFASYINLEGAERIVVTDNVFGDQDGRAPFGIYEGARNGQNNIRANRQVERR